MTDNRGFLTDVDRLFLRGGKKYDQKQARYKRRKAIRERTREAFYDLALLHETLDQTERNKIFDPPAGEASELMTAMIKSFAFLYHSLEGDAGSNAVDWDRSFRYPFAQVLEAGVELGEIARQEHTEESPFSGRVDVTFEVDVSRIQPTDQSRVVEDLVEHGGRGLTDEELRTTIIHAARDPDQFRKLADAIEERRDDVDE